MAHFQLNGEEAQAAFMQTLILEAYERGIRSALQILEAPTEKRPPTWRAAGEWFVRLPAEDQRVVADIVRMVADASVFGCCCVLDNMKLTPLGERKLTFALIAEEHIPKKDAPRDAAVPVRINTRGLDLLHDYFRSMVKIWPEKSESSTQAP